MEETIELQLCLGIAGLTIIEGDRPKMTRVALAIFPKLEKDKPNTIGT